MGVNHLTVVPSNFDPEEAGEPDEPDAAPESD